MSTSPNGVMSRLASRAAVLVIAVMPAACILRNPPDAAAIKAESMTHVAVPAQWTAAGAGAGEVADNWLVEFHDDQLTAAVIEAIAHNANLQIGAARVEVAQRHAKLAGAKLYPSVDLLAKGGGDLGGDSSGIQGAILTMNWELDLWGRVRYGRAAAAADALSVQADFEFARQSIAAQVAKAWFLAIEAGLQAEVARRAITDSESLVNLAAVRVKVGAGNEEDLYVARASVGTYRDALRDIELAREQALRSLELLIGRYPSGTAAVSPSPARAARRRTGRAAIGAPRTPSRRHRGRTPGRGRVQPHTRSTGRAPPGPLAVRRDQLDYQRPVRARGPGESQLELRRQPGRADLSRRRAQDPGGNPHGGTEAGGGRVRGCRTARVRRSRIGAGRGDRRTRSRKDPRRDPVRPVSARCRWSRPSSRSAAPIFGS